MVLNTMNKFIEAIFNGSSFDAQVMFNVLHRSSIQYRCKIDTGCSLTVIPIARFIGEGPARRLKSIDVEKGVPYVCSYGVSDTVEIKNRDKQLIESGRLLECTALKFRHTSNPLILNGYDLGEQDVYINYDRTGNILIGTDILQQLDIHIGADRWTGRLVMLGCLRSAITEEYLDRLYDAFGLVYSV